MAEDEREELVKKHLEQLQQRDTEMQRNEVIRLEMLDQIRVSTGVLMRPVHLNA